MTKTRRKDVCIGIVKELVDVMDQLIEEGKVPYRSRQEFLSAAVRRLLEHYWEIFGRPGSGSEEKP